MTNQMVPYGRIGTLFARGSINAQALIALVEGGVFEQLPDLRVVVTGLAWGSVTVKQLPCPTVLVTEILPP